MKESDGILILFIIVFAYIFYKKYTRSHFESKKVCNSLDERCYPIASKYNPTTYKTASEKLAYLNKFCLELMKYMRNKYLFEGKGTAGQKRMVSRIMANYNPDTIVENVPIDKNFTSYVDDKGAVKFAICLREKNTKEENFHNNNILEYVVMHEMSHMGSIAFGHDDPEFWINLKNLISDAKEAGLHEPINYELTPVNYCSLPVDYNPYFDTSLPPNVK